MPSHVARSRPPRGDVRLPARTTDPDVLAAHLEDAARFPGGHADALYAASSEGEVAAILAAHDTVLPIGAQSSLTGGATPHGGVLLSTARLNRILEVGRDVVRVQPGVTLAELDAALTVAGRYYPPAPTFAGAFVGGTIATNAAGAATFKYGSTRDWVDSLTVVLACGDVLEIRRGETHAHADGHFDLELTRGTVRIPVPTYSMPRVAKLSAGYFAAPGMDLIDVFIGAEGTLGVITEAALRVLRRRPAPCLIFVTFDTVEHGLSFVRRVRDTSIVSAIEHMDAASLALLHEDGIDRQNGLDVAGAAFAVLATIELPPGSTAAEAYEQIAASDSSPAPALSRFCAALAELDALDRAVVATPGDDTTARRLLAIREAVPAAVNQRVARLKQTAGEEAEKVAADVIVPFERIDALLAFCEAAFTSRGLSGAVWGHISDGNLHPNVVPRSRADVSAGKEAVYAIAREAMRLGGAPLAEHGVGRNRIKQQLLRELYGDRGIDEMRRIKSVLDPDWKLAPGVLFDR